MSKKTILFSVPAKAPRSREPVGDGAGSRSEGAVIDVGSDDWVSDRHARAEDRPAKTAGPEPDPRSRRRAEPDGSRRAEPPCAVRARLVLARRRDGGTRPVLGRTRETAANSRVAVSAPIIVGRCDRGELDRDHVACRDQGVGIVRVAEPAALQPLHVFLHGMNGVARKRDRQRPSVFRRPGDQGVVGDEWLRRRLSHWAISCSKQPRSRSRA